MKRQREDHQLSPSQQTVYDQIMSKKSIFFTGEAGSGKTYLLETVIKALNPRDTYVTASTGIAANLIGGTTLHSFAGVGLANLPADVLAKELLNGRYPRQTNAVARWQNARVLIIDECSMIDASFFCKLDHIARVVRGKMQEPFGGIQVILSGDFFQLPPVTKNRAVTGQDMIFSTDVWRDLIKNNIYVLCEAHRQKDALFLGFLGRLRRGEMTRADTACLFRRMRPVPETLESSSIKLFPTRMEVDAINEVKMAEIRGAEHVYHARDHGTLQAVEAHYDSWRAVDRLVLKQNAWVMFIYNVNIEGGIFNGATGHVVDFVPGSDLPIVQLSATGAKVVATRQTWEIRQGEQTIVSRTQIPLLPAWAITIHKSQGMTLPMIELNMNKLFERAQLYVALSRCTSIDNVYVSGKHPRTNMTKPHPDVVKWWDTIKPQINMLT